MGGHMCFWQVLKVDGTSEHNVCHTSVMFAESVVISSRISEYYIALRFDWTT